MKLQTISEKNSHKSGLKIKDNPIPYFKTLIRRVAGNYQYNTSRDNPFISTQMPARICKSCFNIAKRFTLKNVCYRCSIFTTLHFLKTCLRGNVSRYKKSYELRETFKQKCFKSLLPHHIEYRKFRII